VTRLASNGRDFAAPPRREVEHSQAKEQGQMVSGRIRACDALRFGLFAGQLTIPVAAESEPGRQPLQPFRAPIGH